MIRIRFHGRGGHGVKTASRIVGTAAFLAGYQVQDSPLYGAERRGAAVTASTRIADSPILERGAVGQPDLIIVADETLLNDPSAGVLAGQSSASVVFLNTTRVDASAAEHGITAPVISRDVSGRTLAILGRASALSAGLGAAAARLCGVVSAEHLRQALLEELRDLGLPEDLVEKNQRVAAEVFEALAPVEIAAREAEEAEEIVHVPHHDPVTGSPSILALGNSLLRHTGSWRVERPLIDRDLCTRCGLCVVRCPDGVIALDGEGYPVIDYDHCKGCMICRHECPAVAVTAEKETEAW